MPNSLELWFVGRKGLPKEENLINPLLDFLLLNLIRTRALLIAQNHPHIAFHIMQSLYIPIKVLRFQQVKIHKPFLPIIINPVYLQLLHPLKIVPRKRLSKFTHKDLLCDEVNFCMNYLLVSCTDFVLCGKELWVKGEDVLGKWVLGNGVDGFYCLEKDKERLWNLPSSESSR